MTRQRGAYHCEFGGARGEGGSARPTCEVGFSLAAPAPPAPRPRRLCSVALVNLQPHSCTFHSTRMA